VLDHISRRTLDTSDIGIVVLDEADRMLDIGFRPDIEKILRQCPRERQTLLLSATLPPPILLLAQRYMKDPVALNFSAEDIAVETIDQYYYTVDQNKKFELLKRLLKREQPKQAIVFCRTKRGTDWIHLDLKKEFENVGCMHGDMAQNQRNRMMEKFRAGDIKILVATDVVGRGIDVTGISHIINYDVPQDCDDYVHRVGRTGRMGREGVAFTLVTLAEGHELTKIEKRIGKLLNSGPPFEDFELTMRPVEREGEGPPRVGSGPGGRSPKKKYRRRL
jgi:ATP-dependent RNA helicase DeaD